MQPKKACEFQVLSRFKYLFFFSSRRRHTRFKCDWSSDVCSSDLTARAASLIHASASRRAGYLEGINDAARAVATGDSPSTLVDQIAGSLAQLLSDRKSVV